MTSYPDALEVRGRRIILGWAQVGEGTLDALTPDERALLKPEAVPARVRQFVAGRLAAQRALTSLGFQGKVLRTPPYEEDAGRPYVATLDGARAPSVAISLSHSGALACAAIATGAAPLGMDLEAAALDASPAFLEEAFAPGELRGFAPFADLRLDPLRAAWTLKEAVLKVWGVGLRVPLPRLHLQPSGFEAREDWVGCELEIAFRGPNPPPGRMVARVRQIGGAVLSLALPT